MEMVDNLGIRLKLLSSSRYILAARYVMQRIGLKYVKELVYERPFDTEIAAVKTRIPVEVRTVSIEDIKNGLYEGIRLASGDEPVQHNEALGRICNGGVCFVAMIENKVAGFAWLYFQKRKYEPAIEREEAFRDDEALIYDTFSFPEFRRSGIGSKLNEEGLRYLKSKGYKKSLVYIQADNIPSIKSFEAVGFYPTKIITCLRIFKFKRIKERPVNYSQTQMNEMEEN
jgi:GNAT superfamily N-acetyltransferase